MPLLLRPSPHEYAIVGVYCLLVLSVGVIARLFVKDADGYRFPLRRFSDGRRSGRPCPKPMLLGAGALALVI